MHEIRVSVISAEGASVGVAELWANGRMIGFTEYEDGDLMLHIEPPTDAGTALVVGVHGLADALAEVDRRLALF